MNKKEILKQLKKEYPLIRWSVSEQENDFIIRGAYELEAMTLVSKKVDFAMSDIISDLGEGHYADMKRKVTTFPEKE